MAGFQRQGPVDCSVDIDCRNIRGKTAIVTSGANGIGEAYTRALIAASACIAIGDLNVAGSKKLISESRWRAHFVNCNVTSWNNQTRLYRKTELFSPTTQIHYVVANAGTIRQDEVFAYSEEPTEPGRSTVDVNLKGTLYTTRLAMHYFIKQNATIPSTSQHDAYLVLIGSGAGTHDCLRIAHYSAAKWAAHGIMPSLRRRAYFCGSRVSVITLSMSKPKILPDQDFDNVRAKGVEFAATEDAGQCLRRI